MSITPNTPIVFTSLLNSANRMNYNVYGMALLTGGLVQVVQVNGVGLETFGLIWQMPEIWFDPQSVLNLSTGWTAAAGYSGSATLITTGWTVAAGYSGCLSASLVTTVWAQSSAFGDFEII